MLYPFLIYNSRIELGRAKVNDECLDPSPERLAISVKSVYDYTNDNSSVSNHTIVLENILIEEAEKPFAVSF